MNQTKNMNTLLKRYGMENCTGVITPVKPSVKFQFEPEDDDMKNLSTKRNTKYSSAIYVFVL